MRIRLAVALSFAGLLLVPAVASSGPTLGPDLDLTGAQKQEAGNRVAVKVACQDQVCTATATGRIQLLCGRSATTAVSKGALRLKPATMTDPAKFFRLKPGLKKAGLKAVRKTLRKGNRAKVKITVTATGVNGGTTVKKKTVELKPVGFHFREPRAAG